MPTLASRSPNTEPLAKISAVLGVSCPWLSIAEVENIDNLGLGEGAMPAFPDAGGAPIWWYAPK